MAHVLFVCLHNAGRSQISQALFEHAAGGRHTADSAGTTPADRVHPQVVAVMRQLGIDLTGQAPQRLTDELAQRADIVITMGCGDQCPYIPGKRYLDWDLPDPKDRPIEEVRATRDEIARRVRSLLDELDRTQHTDDCCASKPASEALSIAQCHLDIAGRRDQADRYRRLGATATHVERRGDALVATFGDRLDKRLLEETIAVERDCCPFFDFDLQTDQRRLSITVQHPAQRPALDALHHALTVNRYPDAAH